MLNRVSRYATAPLNFNVRTPVFFYKDEVPIVRYE